MQYTPIYEQKGHRITETYEVAGVTYEAVIVINNLGFAMGMAGFDPFSVEISLQSANEAEPHCFSVLLPKRKKSEVLIEERFIVPDGRLCNSYRFTAPGEAKLAEAVHRYHATVKLYEKIGRRPNRFVVRLDGHPSDIS